jgi:hypothetical protein
MRCPQRPKYWSQWPRPIFCVNIRKVLEKMKRGKNMTDVAKALSG